MIYEDYNYNKGEGLDHCGICNRRFSEGEPVKVLEFPKGPFKIICSNCIQELNEAVNSLPKIEQKHNFNVSKDIPELKSENKLWRYMDLAKFICMLKDSKLFFSSPKGFDDIYEGAHGELKNKEAWDDFYLSFARTSIITAPDNCWHNVDKAKLEQNARRLVDEISAKHGRPIFISCWYQNEYESEAMWKMYSKDVTNAIAIQTTFGKLQQQIGDRAKIKRVKYIDYSKQFVGPNDEYWCKRKSFEYENEVRAVLYDFETKDKFGILLDVDIKNLVLNSYISPYAPDWFYPLVVDLVSKYGYDFKVSHSCMNELPF